MAIVKMKHLRLVAMAEDREGILRLLQHDQGFHRNAGVLAVGRRAMPGRPPTEKGIGRLLDEDYVTVDNQRIPVLRVMSANGENYYLDNKGTVMPPSAKCVAHLAVATGKIDKNFAKNKLYPFGMYLQNDPFWNAQIEQIHVLSGKTVELVPRVGDHLIYLGRIDGYERKLKRVKVFYQKALNQVGWNKYSRISVEFDNQVICTRR